MPLVKPKNPHAESPEGPHLALLTDEDGGAIALPKGAVLLIIEAPNDPNRMYPIAIKSVTRKRLEFICPCGQPSCTRKVVWTANWSGQHPQGGSNISVKTPPPQK